MGTSNDDLLRRAEALAQTAEPTAEMIAATDAEVSAEPAAFVPLGISEELSGGAGAMYLREIANHDLLNQQDEVALAQRMEIGHEAGTCLAGGDLSQLDETELARLKQLVED